MTHDLLLGNQQLLDRLDALLAQDRLPHCFLISGPVGSGKKPLSRLICAAYLCTAPQGRPCLHCPQCRKVLSGTHPDVVVVDQPDKQTVPVALVRQACADAYIRPNEGARKIYLFPRAHDLNPQGQNTLLKILEEPPAYGVFLLLTDNPDRILPTVRSRCATLSLSPLPVTTILGELQRRFPQADPSACRTAAEQSGGFLGPAITALQATPSTSHTTSFGAVYAARDRLALLQLTTGLERLSHEQLQDTLQQWLELLCAALRSRAGIPSGSEADAIARSHTEQELSEGIDTLRCALEYCHFYVSAGHIMGMLAARLSPPHRGR
jgi:DNA polymerase-3 subunit delta'